MAQGSHGDHLKVGSESERSRVLEHAKETVLVDEQCCSLGEHGLQTPSNDSGSGGHGPALGGFRDGRGGPGGREAHEAGAECEATGQRQVRPARPQMGRAALCEHARAGSQNGESGRA